MAGKEKFTDIARKSGAKDFTHTTSMLQIEFVGL